MQEWSGLIGWLNDSQGLAGWAQAIGALITLWVSLYIPARSRREQQRDAERAYQSVLGDTIAAIVATHVRVHKEESLPERGVAMLREHIRALREFPATSLRPKSISSAMLFRSAATNYLDTAVAYSDAWGKDNERVMALRSHAEVAAKHLLNCMVQLASKTPRLDLAYLHDALVAAMQGVLLSPSECRVARDE